MPGKLIEVSPSAYEYPLLIKHLLHYPLANAPDQEIVYRDLRRTAIGIPRPHQPARERADGDRRQGGRCRRRT